MKIVSYWILHILYAHCTCVHYGFCTRHLTITFKSVFRTQTFELLYTSTKPLIFSTVSWRYNYSITKWKSRTSALYSFLSYTYFTFGRSRKWPILKFSRWWDSLFHRENIAAKLLTVIEDISSKPKVSQSQRISQLVECVHLLLDFRSSQHLSKYLCSNLIYTFYPSSTKDWSPQNFICRIIVQGSLNKATASR